MRYRWAPRTFVDPFVWPKLIEGLTAYLERHGHRAVRDIVGTVEVPGAAGAPQRISS